MSDVSTLPYRFGVDRTEALTGSLFATVPPALNPPASFDASLGGHIPTWLMGNGEWGNCFWCAARNVFTAQAIVSLTNVDQRLEANYATGSTCATLARESGVAVRWYQDYLTSQGQPFDTPPGGGTGITSGAQYLLDHVPGVLAVGIIPSADLQAPGVLEAAISETHGGVILCLALDPDAQTEFVDRVPWGTDSTNPDYQDGHAVDALAFNTPGVFGSTGLGVLTWASTQGTTPEFDKRCIDGAVLVVTDGLRARGVDVNALITRWGLTRKAVTPADPGSEPVGDSWASAVEAKPEPLTPAQHTSFLQATETRLRELLKLVTNRVLPDVMVKELERLAEDALKRYV